MQSASGVVFRLGLVKDEFSEAFVRAAAAKRAGDSKATLSAVEREATEYLEQSMVEFRHDLDCAGTDRPHRPSRRFAPVRRADVTRTITLIGKLREQQISTADAARLIQLLMKVDLRRRRRARYQEVAAFGRGLGF